MLADGLFFRREFSFTFKGDHYARFRSYQDVDSWSKDVRKGVPHKIDIGAVYNYPVSTNSTYLPKYFAKPRDKLTIGDKFAPQEKDLVFDIDMSDYNSLRNCCTGTSICSKCWPWMTISIKVIDTVIRGNNRRFSFFCVLSYKFRRFRVF